MNRETYEHVEEVETKDFETIKKELEQTMNNGSYRIGIIKRTLHDKPKIRRTMAVAILLSPFRIGEAKEKLIGVRKTIYSYIYELVNLGLLTKISIMDLWNKKEDELSDDENIVIKKFKDWTERMAEGQIQYFAGKTNYFILTDLGKDPEIGAWVLKHEQELKNE